MLMPGGQCHVGLLWLIQEPYIANSSVYQELLFKRSEINAYTE